MKPINAALACACLFPALAGCTPNCDRGDAAFRASAAALVLTECREPDFGVNRSVLETLVDSLAGCIAASRAAIDILRREVR